jgi:hypothetical protein
MVRPALALVGGVVVEISIGTVIGVMGLICIVAVYFLWARKLGQKKEQ